MKKAALAERRSVKGTGEQILEGAMKLFSRKGYHGTSIEEIAKAAGVTKGALYWHFQSKDDLLRHVILHYEKNFLNRIIQKVKTLEGDAFEKFEKYARDNAAFVYYNRELCVSFITLAGEIVGSHHALEREFRRVYKKYENFLSELIIQGQNEEIFKKEIDPKLTALVIVAIIDGVTCQWSMNRDEIDGKAFETAFRNIMYHGFVA